MRMALHKRLSVYLSFILAVTLVLSACSKSEPEQGATENVEETVTVSSTDDSAFGTEAASDAAQVSLAGESENDFASAQGSGVQGQAQASVGTAGSSVSGSANGAQNQPQAPSLCGI